MVHHRPKVRFDEDRLCVLDIETVSTEPTEPGVFPPWPTHTPIVASMLKATRNTIGEWSFELESTRFDEDPAAALRQVDDALDGRSCITLNGRGFDLPVLLLAAQKACKFRLTALTAAAAEPRYSSGRHYDLADIFGHYGAARGASLERLCSALGIPAKVCAHGSEVGDLYARGEMAVIEAYCETDVAATLRLAAYARATQTGDATYHASLTSQFARWSRADGREHLAPYAELPKADELLRLSLTGQLDGALEAAAFDADCRAKEAIDASFGPVTHY